MTTFRYDPAGRRVAIDDGASSSRFASDGDAIAADYDATNSLVNPFTYTGQFLDPTSGLLLFPLRPFDPTIGRFLSEDPVPSVNPYRYVTNDPINLTDPSGASAFFEKAALYARAVGVVIGTYKRGQALNQGKPCEAGVYFVLAVLSGIGFLGALDRVSAVKDAATAGAGVAGGFAVLIC